MSAVLIADDSPLVLRMIEGILSDAGIDVVTAQDGLEAVDRVFEGDIAVVILDVMMPRMNGYQACRLLKSEPATSDIPVVILTSKDQAGDRFWGLETGADYYVTKDQEPRRILELVKQILTGREGRPQAASAEPLQDVDVLSRVNELLDRKLFAATILSEIGRVAGTLDHFDETFSSLMTILTRVVDFSVAGMAFVDGSGVDALLVPQRPAIPAVLEEARSRLLEAITESHPGFEPNEAHLEMRDPLLDDGPQQQLLGGFAVFPVVADGQLKGLMAVGGRSTTWIDPDTRDLLEQVANLSYVVAVNSRLLERLRHLSMRDSLTDLLNHRHSIEVIANEFERVGRYAGGVSVVMIDIDHFKAVNDRHGHQMGDSVLRDVARLMKDLLRNVDSLGRYGGEEFVAVLPHTSDSEARQTAERLREAVERHTFRAGSVELRITVSLGVATYPSKSVDSPGSLIREADQALYKAKEAGRNCVV